MAIIVLVLVLISGYLSISIVQADENSTDYQIEVSAAEIVLSGVPFSIYITLPAFLSADETIPEIIYYSLQGQGNVSNHTTRDSDGLSLQLEINNTVIHSTGHHSLQLNFSRTENTSDMSEFLCAPLHVKMYGIPGVITILPPIFAAVIAIVFRQVLFALIFAIWMAAFFAAKFNPLTAVLRTLDTYIVGSVADFDHAAILIFSLFLGGMIGVIQKSGGGIGLANLLRRFTKSRRSACLVAAVVSVLIFFDDYCCVLIAGNSLRSVVSGVGVSKEKFSFIIQSIAPCVPSIIPISSWIGVEVGYVQSSLAKSGCTSMDPFVLIINTIPYRFFPLLMVFCVVLVCVLNRDFGPMLAAEQAMNHCQSQSPRDTSTLDTAIELHNQAAPEEIFSGPLAPKKGVPYRWFNAVVPFLVTVIITLLGMVLGGRQAILNMPTVSRVNMTVVNIFTNADSIAALTWASFLACFIAMVMLRLQKILYIREFVESWIEGIKEIVEPLLVLILAWALGDVIEVIHTSSYVAQILQNGGLSADYIPAIVAFLGCVISFATGSAFGSMGILFPLVIPIIAKLTDCDSNALLQTTAAVLASCIFGNVLSPIADLTILTGVASQCSLTSHVKTASLYAVLVGFLSIVFGTLPVGAGWYPWYAAWIIMIFLLVAIYVCFSVNARLESSRSLCKIVCPCAFSITALVSQKMKSWFYRIKFCRKMSQKMVVNDENSESSKLLP